MPFSDIHISQGSVATCLRRGGIFKHEFVANLLLSPLVKKFWKSDNSWWNYGQEFGVLFFWLTMYNSTFCSLCKSHKYFFHTGGIPISQASISTNICRDSAGFPSSYSHSHYSVLSPNTGTMAEDSVIVLLLQTTALCVNSLIQWLHAVLMTGRRQTTFCDIHSSGLVTYSYDFLRCDGSCLCIH